MQRVKILLLALSVVLALFMVIGISHAISPIEQARIFSEENLTEWLKTVQPIYQDFGYTSQEQVMQSHIGDPVESYTINLADFDPSKSIAQQEVPFPFYSFPVIADNQIKADFTVCLQNGAWRFVDFGGNLNRNIEKIVRESGLKNTKILRFAGEIFVVAQRGNERVGFAPYFEDTENGLKAGRVVSEGIIKKAMTKKKQDLLDISKHGLDGGSGDRYSTLEFTQESAVKRLIKYIRHALQ